MTSSRTSHTTERDRSTVEIARGFDEIRIDGRTRVVFTDHDAPDIADALAIVLKSPARFVGVMGSRRHVGPYVERFGDDNLVFSTDYPHADSKFPHAVEAFGTLPLSAASRKKILWDNWSRLYGIDRPAPA